MPAFPGNLVQAHMTNVYIGLSALINTPIHGGVWRLRTAGETVSNGLPACVHHPERLAHSHVFAFVLPRMVACGLGDPGTQAPADQARRRKGIRLPPSVRLRERPLYENQ